MGKATVRLLLILMILLYAGVCPALAVDDISSDAEMFSYTPDETVNIIFDTDIDTDVDDVGALAVLHSYAQEGRANILATVGSCKSGHAVPCISGINAYYGFPDVAVGIAPNCPSSGQSPYQTVLATIYGNDAPRDEDAKTALEVYRSSLASAHDNSVVIIAVGALNNLSDLLQSEADCYSSLSGVELIKQKAKLCVIMGGIFLESNSREEYNFRLDADAAYHVVHNCPVPILWSGSEIGSSIFTGNMRSKMEMDNPVRLAYNLYGKDGTGNYARKSWDLTTIMYAVEGAGEYWDVQPVTIEVNTAEGIVDPEKGPGYNSWAPDPTSKDAMLLKKMDPEKLAEILNERMLQARKSQSIMLNGDISRGDVAVVFHQLAGHPMGNSATFLDVSAESRYADAVFWAAENSIAIGYGNGRFGVKDSITREQLAVVLYRYAQSVGIDTNCFSHLDGFDDEENVSEYAQEAMNWSVEVGLMSSVENNLLCPKDIVTQEQFATVLIQYCTVIFS